MNSKDKIFADFNNCDSYGRVRLNNKGTIDDLIKQRINLKENLEILIDDTDGLSANCIVKFSYEENIWVGVIDWNKLQR